jgi:hypothetical protein
MERLRSAKWLEIFESYRDLKKVEKHWTTLVTFWMYIWFRLEFSSDLMLAFL